MHFGHAELGLCIELFTGRGSTGRGTELGERIICCVSVIPGGNNRTAEGRKRLRIRHFGVRSGMSCV